MLLVSLVSLIGCSKVPESNYSHTLFIDEKSIFDEHETASDKSYGKMKEQYKELKAQLDNACIFSGFLKEDKTIATGENEIITKSTESKIQKIPKSNIYMDCVGTKSGVVPRCDIHTNNGPESKQKQYFLDLVDYLKSEYGMQNGAIFNEKISLVSDDKSKSLDIDWKVIISKENIRCTKISELKHLKKN